MDGDWFLTSYTAYTVSGRRVQGRPGQGWRRPRSRRLRACPRGKPFFSCAVPVPGCPLADDRVALKQRVKEANDIVDVVGSYIALRPAGLTFKGMCPFHDDHRPSLDVDPGRQRYRCWACNKSGDA